MTPAMPPLILNGAPEPHTGISLLQLVQRETGHHLRADGRTATGRPCGVAAAVNDEVVPRSAWAATVPHPGDRIELLSAVQGG